MNALYVRGKVGKECSMDDVVVGQTQMLMTPTWVGGMSWLGQRRAVTARIADMMLHGDVDIG